MAQMSMFDGTHKFTITKPIRLIELFAGYGSQALALKYLSVPFESWRTCEWAIKSIQAYKDMHFGDDNTDYSANHSIEFVKNRLLKWGISSNYNEPMTKEQIQRLSETACRKIYNNVKATHNLVNIQMATADDFGIEDTDKYTYIMTYSFPCQDLSSAGKRKGMSKGEKTRSGMLWEVERILLELDHDHRPQVLLMENVPQVIQAENMRNFSLWIHSLERMGYKNYWQVLNSKDFGVPQSRERCYMVSILGDYYYEFPTSPQTPCKLQDVLEDEVPENYYLTDKSVETSLRCNFVQDKLESRLVNHDKVSPTITATNEQHPIIVSDRGGAYA